MKKNFIFLFLITILISSCNSDGVICKNKNVIIRHYNHLKLKHSDTMQLDCYYKNDKIHYIYKIKNDTSIYSFSKNLTNDSTIKSYIDFKLTLNKTIIIERIKYKVSKYQSVNKRNYFYNDAYGLLLVSGNDKQGYFLTISYNSISESIIQSIVNDTTGFFICNVSLPPQNSNSVIFLKNI